MYLAYHLLCLLVIIQNIFYSFLVVFIEQILVEEINLFNSVQHLMNYK